MILAAFANVGARAQEYKDSGAFAGARMDQLRVMAYMDLLNAVPPANRIARAIALARAEAEAHATQHPDDSASDGPACDNSARDDPGPDDPDSGETGEDGPGPDDSGPGGPGVQPGGASPSRGPEPKPGGKRGPALQDLIIPLRTLLGLASKPGEGHNLGPLDPGLALDLAAAAAMSAYSEWCITIVDADGIAIGHGCARPGRHSPPLPSAAAASWAAPAAFPARVNLTIPASALPGLIAMHSGLESPNGPNSPNSLEGPGRRGSPWTLTPRDDPGPPGGYGTWTLTLPGWREFTVRLAPVPVFDCDHRNESHAYQPNDTLRHLVQVRDGKCTFPPCSRHARESDFEHALPYEQGGRTCACNAGARSRRCHRVKQSPGWNVTQPRPGWHQWTTPSGRTYTQGPKQYPA